MPQQYIRNKDDFAPYIISHATRLSKKVLERLHYNRIKVTDHSQIFCESCILILHLNRRNLLGAMGENGSCQIILGMMPQFKRMLEAINNRLYNNADGFQERFYAQYLEREMVYKELGKDFSDIPLFDHLINLFIEYIVPCTAEGELDPAVCKDLKSSIAMLIIPYGNIIKSEIDRGYYLFVYKYLLFRQKAFIR
jgi:hypothetical protein